MTASHIYNEKKLTVALANAISIWGGSENRLVIMARELTAVGHRVVFYHRNPEIAKRLEGTNVETVCLPFSNDVDPLTWMRLLFHMSRIKPDILIFSDDRAMRLAGSTARLAGVPLRVHVKGHMHFKMSQRTRKVYKIMTTHVMCVTDAVRKLVEEAGLFPKDRLGVIYLPFNPLPFQECKTRNLREELGIPETATLFGNVARLSGMKGQKHFIEAARAVVDQAPDTAFVIAGKGRLEQELREQINSLGLEDYVTLAGHRNDIPDVMNSIDVMVLSSTFGEALGGATLEAMAASRPAIVTRLGGLPELVDDGKSGLIVQPGDSEALAEAMLSLHKDRESRLEMGRQAHAILLERFTPKRFWQAWNPLFEQAARL